MEFLFLLTGVTTDSFVKEGMDLYASRIKHYVNFEIREIKPGKKGSKKLVKEQKKQEAAAIMKHLEKSDFLVLLDEHGKQYTSRRFADFIQKKMNAGYKRIVFLVGGAYGFDEALKNRADALLSLSEMTFPHQLIRIIFLEQLYRAYTILNNEPYHNV